jgi:hypothetical protein
MGFPNDKELARIYDKIKSARVEELERLAEINLDKLHQQWPKLAAGPADAPEIDKDKIVAFVSLMKRMGKDEFIEYMTTGELPSIKLNKREMEIVTGGMARKLAVYLTVIFGQ